MQPMAMGRDRPSPEANPSSQKSADGTHFASLLASDDEKADAGNDSHEGDRARRPAASLSHVTPDALSTALIGQLVGVPLPPADPAMRGDFAEGSLGGSGLTNAVDPPGGLGVGGDPIKVGLVGSADSLTDRGPGSEMAAKSAAPEAAPKAAVTPAGPSSSSNAAPGQPLPHPAAASATAAPGSQASPAAALRAVPPDPILADPNRALGISKPAATPSGPARAQRSHGAGGASEAAASSKGPALESGPSSQVAPLSPPASASNALDAAPSVKSLTDVITPPQANAHALPDVGARLRDALASVANQAVLRGAATGQIEVPELGRVAVRAESTGGAVNVDVAAERSETRDALRQHSGAMTADLREADVRVARLNVASHASEAHSTPSHGGATNDSPTGHSRDSYPRDRQGEGDEPISHHVDTDERPAGRVRIVL
jgi:hypothetical protein